MIKFGMTVAQMIGQLTRGFIKQTGRLPSGLEKIKIQQEAIQRSKDMNKVLDMKGNPIDPAKPIMGGSQQKTIKQGDDITSDNFGTSQFAPGPRQRRSLSKEEILQNLKIKNKEAIERLKNKKEPEDMAGGGVAGLLGESPRQNFAMGKRAFLNARWRWRRNCGP